MPATITGPLALPTTYFSSWRISAPFLRLVLRVRSGIGQPGARMCSQVICVGPDSVAFAMGHI
jgi:hypothetical protein